MNSYICLSPDNRHQYTAKAKIYEKGQTMIYKTLHKKLKIKLHEPHKKPGRELGCSGRVSSSCFTSATHRITLVSNIYMRNSNKYKLKKSLSIVKCMLLCWVNIEQHKYGMTFFLFIFIWISYVDIPDRPIMADQRWGWAFTSSMTKVVGVDVWKVWRYQRGYQKP